jgi:hypothetical protein
VPSAPAVPTGSARPPYPLQKSATTSLPIQHSTRLDRRIPRFHLSSTSYASVSSPDSSATVGSYATAHSILPSRTATPQRYQRASGHSPSPLPPLATLDGSSTYSQEAFLSNREEPAVQALESNQTKDMSSRRNGTNGARHTTNGEDHAAHEPLIARENDPDSRRKAESMNRKLRTYEAILALKQGYMPDMQQLAGWGRYILHSSALDSRNRRLSSKGREFIRDVRAWIEALTDLGMSKNYDDKIQEFLYHTSHANLLANVPAVGSAARAGVSGAEQDTNRLIGKLRKMTTLLWSSDEFRRLINDFAGIRAIPGSSWNYC